MKTPICRFEAMIKQQSAELKEWKGMSNVQFHVFAAPYSMINLWLNLRS